MLTNRLGAPIVPDGVAGTISHKDYFAAAAAKLIPGLQSHCIKPTDMESTPNSKPIDSYLSQHLADSSGDHAIGGADATSAVIGDCASVPVCQTAVTSHIGVDFERTTNKAASNLQVRLLTESEQDSLYGVGNALPVGNNNMSKDGFVDNEAIEQPKSTLEANQGRPSNQQPLRPHNHKKTVMDTEVANKNPKWSINSLEEDVMLRFSFKESLYKALNPILERYVEFLEAEVYPNPNNGTARIVFKLHSGENFDYTAEYEKYQDKFWLTCVHLWKV